MANANNKIVIKNNAELDFTIGHEIVEKYQFSGMAMYLNQVQYYLIDDQIINIDRTNNQAQTLKSNQWLAIVGRYNVLLIKSIDDQLSFVFKNEKLNILSYDGIHESFLINKLTLAKLDNKLDSIRYFHLWKPFAIIAKTVESTLVFLKKLTALSWGLVILLFTVIVKLLLYPLSMMTLKSQQSVSKITSQLQPKLKKIKENYNGEEAHNKIMKAHKDLGVSPFYTLKPMISFLIQIPILIGVFNALGEMPQLQSQAFLWFNDLSLPDKYYSFNSSILFLGNSVNIMPIIMTLVTLLSSIFHNDRFASNVENKKQKVKLYFMALSFLILFYPFPVVMVMYWTMTNLLQFIQLKLVKS